MAQKYFNSQDAAKALGVSVDEVRKMLDRRELHGYRDGADWKFKTEEIERLIKERAPQQPDASAGDEGGDVLLSEVELGHSDPGTSGTVIAMNWGDRGATDSDIQLGSSDLSLAADSNAPAIAKKAAKSDELTLASDEELSLKDSSAALAAIMGKSSPRSGPGASDIDLSGSKSDDNLVLAGSKPGSDVTLSSSDSGISLVDPSDSGLSLEEAVLTSTGEE